MLTPSGQRLPGIGRTKVVYYRCRQLPLLFTPISIRFRWRGEGAPGQMGRPGSRPALLGRPGHISGVPSRPKHPAQRLALDVGSPHAAQAAGTSLTHCTSLARPIQPTRPLYMTHSRAQNYLGAFVSYAVRERQVARPVSRRRAARPTGQPIARICGALRHITSCVSEHRRPTALQGAPSLPI